MAASRLHHDLLFLIMQLSEGYDETAAVCALQRAGNAMGRAREYLDTPVMREHFKESAAVSHHGFMAARLGAPRRCASP